MLLFGAALFLLFSAESEFISVKLIVERVAYDIVARNRNIAAVGPHGADYTRVGGNMYLVRIRK